MSRKLGRGLKTPRKFKIGQLQGPGNFIKTILPAGMAAPAPPLGPMLGQRGIPIGSFCNDFNQRTTHYKPGIPMRVEINIKADRSYDLEIMVPPTSWFLKAAAGIEKYLTPNYKDTSQPASGVISRKHVYEIAKIKQLDGRLKYDSLQSIYANIIRQCHVMKLDVVDNVTIEDINLLREKRAHWEEIERQKSEALAASDADR